MDKASDRKIHVRGDTYRLTLLRGPAMAPVVPLLFGTFRRPEFTLGWLQKKYSCKFGGIEGFSCAALTETGEAAACVGMLPWPIRFGERTELAAQMVDVATHDEHRRRGLFTQLGEMVREICDAAGFSFLFGFADPKNSVFRGWVGPLGYTHLEEVSLVEYAILVRTLWIERLARRAGTLGPIYDRGLERRLKPLLPRDPAPPNSFLAEGFAGTDRDARFFDYKKLLGNQVLAVEGGRVWVKIKRGLIVGDMEAGPQTEIEKTVRRLQRLAARFGIHQVLFQLSKGTRLSRFFGGRVQERPGLAVVYRNLRSQIPPEKLRFTLGDLDNF
jgi:GNAT superfamily N-acetyltransferase